jgi:hypothetical protein
MSNPSTNETETPLHLLKPAERRTTWWLAAIVGLLAMLLAAPAISHAELPNANNYNCIGKIAAGEPEEGSEDQQVKYGFYCNGPITGYQLESQVPVTGIQGQPEVTSNATTTPLSDTFSCSGEFPGWALNCVGLAKQGYETVTGQFAIGSKLCKEPRVDPLLTVTYAYVEKGAVTQAISGPFDLGRPTGCPTDAAAGGTRLSPKPVVVHHKKKSGKTKTGTKGKKGKKAAHKK